MSNKDQDSDRTLCYSSFIADPAWASAAERPTCAPAPPPRGRPALNKASNGSTLEPLVRKLSYRVKLDGDEGAAILALPFTVKNVERNHIIVREQERATQSCLLLSGYAVRTKIVGTGNRQILAVHMKGEMVDLQNSMLLTADHNVQMLTSGKVAMIPREAVIRLTLERPRIGQAMWIDTLVEGSISREWIANVGRRDARSRISHLLCEFSLRLKVAGLGSDDEYELPMTQEQIADATGLTSVHVNRTLRALEAEGLIARSNPRFVQIGDWRKLAEVGDFDSTYLHLRKDEPALG